MVSPTETAEKLCDGCRRAFDEKFIFYFLPQERDILKELVDLVKYFKDGGLSKGEEEDKNIVYQNKYCMEVTDPALKNMKAWGRIP